MNLDCLWNLRIEIKRFQQNNTEKLTISPVCLEVNQTEVKLFTQY